MFIFAFIMILSYMMYQRYAPIHGVPCVNLNQVNCLKERTVLVDIRDYNLAASKPVNGVFLMPFAYLKRHYEAIEGRDIVLVVSDVLAFNLGVRFLRRKGFNIVGCIKE
jgi:hypothetical protein